MENPYCRRCPEPTEVLGLTHFCQSCLLHSVVNVLDVYRVLMGECVQLGSDICDAPVFSSDVQLMQLDA